MAWVFISIYILALVVIFFYCLMQFILALKYVGAWESNLQQPANPETWPLVTIQLPVFNERYVVEQLIDSVAQMDYPRERLEIQLLDDSTDDAFDIGRKKVEDWQKKGLNIVQVKRPDRLGYKAGALQYGLQKAQGEFIAIFDADFQPKPDFLKRSIPYFQDQEIGVVQSRWGHINRNQNFLTKVQALILDFHFSIEQTGRQAHNVFINFNGTAGVWRRTTIEEGGGWQSDTLTEDLDLSYRAQMKGWRFKYLENLISPAELPAEMNSFKSQQFRWNKGGAETAKKHMRSIWKSKELSFKEKLFGSFHLFSSTNYFFVFLMALVSFPVLITKQQIINDQVFLYGLIFFLGSLGLLFAFFASRKNRRESWLKRAFTFAWLFPSFLCVSLGMSLYNSVAVLQGYLGIKTAFIRTPKFNANLLGQNLMQNIYLVRRVHWTTFLEGVFAVYFGAGIFLAFDYGDYSLLPLHISAFVGFFLTFFFSLYHSLKVSK